MAKPARNKKANARTDKQALIARRSELAALYSCFDRHGVDRLSHLYRLAR